MEFFHHAQVIEVLKAGAGPAYILKGARHILLTVKVVGNISAVTQRLPCIVQHGMDLLPGRERAAFQHQPGTLFERQRVDGNILRAQDIT